MTDIPTHHMVYGHCCDYITGEKLVDTDDERIRQQLARYMVEEQGWEKQDIEMRLRIETLFNQQFVTSKITMVLSLDGARCLMLRYGPGSLVTRERPALAAARVLSERAQVPLVVVTNGVDAELLDTITGKVISTGMSSVPSRAKVKKMVSELCFDPYDGRKREAELRILNAFDVEVCCAGGPCALPGVKEG
ncbi:MAG: type I restriction enzyme HsdR N-terminal domain-containing protein [Desulfobulbaceae bacterium]|jgi:hypothetical protein|nr:type I restriction enzyme HsdR N-terminal domain-containing protein [Desulfobulbaceae bacterium]